MNVSLDDVVCGDNIYMNKRDPLIMRTKIKVGRQSKGCKKISTGIPSKCLNIRILTYDDLPVFIRQYNTLFFFAFLILMGYPLMTINQYDVGATERVPLSNTSESKLNVVDFGAVAGDAIDDTRALQTAINRADREEVTTVYIPTGTYDIYGYLTLKDNITIQGDGQNTTILIDHIISTRNDIIRADNKSNIKILNLAIMGPGIQKSGDCIHFENVTNYFVSYTRLSDCGSGRDGAAIYARNTSNGEITHNIILSARNGYLTPQGGGSKNVFIGYNTILNSRDDAIHPQTGSDNIIVGNIVRDSGDDNIDLWQEDNTLIENNTVVMQVMGNKTVNGIDISDGSTNVVVKKNQIFGPVGRGIKVSDFGNAEETSNTNITIIDNNLRDLQYGCMLVEKETGDTIARTGEVIIHHNRLSNC